MIALKRFADSPFEGQLEVVATVADRAFRASVEELRKQDELTIALRAMLREGISVDELSEATGLTPQEIRRRTEGNLMLLDEDVDELAGLGKIPAIY